MTAFSRLGPELREDLRVVIDHYLDDLETDELRADLVREERPGLVERLRRFKADLDLAAAGIRSAS